jgi:hypothetical protein
MFLHLLGLLIDRLPPQVHVLNLIVSSSQVILLQIHINMIKVQTLFVGCVAKRQKCMTYFLRNSRITFDKHILPICLACDLQLNQLDHVVIREGLYLSTYNPG